MAGNKENTGNSFMNKLATFIVDKRNLFFLLTIIMLIFSAFSRNWVEVESELSAYLPNDSETRQALDVMEEQFATFGSAQVMVANISQEQAEELKDQIAGIKGVQGVEYDNTEDHYNNDSALYAVTFDYDESDDACLTSIDTIQEIAQKYYPDQSVYIAGNSTTEYDFQKSFSLDNTVVSVVSILIVLVVLLFTFKSAGMPVLLILVIQGSIWINFSIPYLLNQPLFFMSYLVVSSIQMGANIDYAIVVANRYQELKEQMHHRDAIIETMNFAFPTIITSGTILAVAGTLIGLMTSTASITGIGQNLGRGTIISILLVMFVLPQILLIGGKVVDKTSFSMPNVSKKYTSHGRVKVDGMVRGEIHGIVSGTMHATVDGDVDLNLISGSALEEGDEDETK